MIEFITDDVLTPIIEFIKTCPFADKYNIDFSEMEVGQFMNMKKPSSMLEYVGSSEINYSVDTNRNVEVVREGHFQLYLLKKTDAKPLQKNTSLFIRNFEQWIEFCQVFDKIPKISNPPWIGEKMTAQNGMFFDQVETEDGGFMTLNLYMIQLALTYKNFYDKELDLEWL